MKAFDKSWLKRRVSLAELPANWVAGQAEWDAFRSQMIDGDELWWYAHRSGFLAAEAGYALKRGEQIVAHFVEIQS